MRTAKSAADHYCAANLEAACAIAADVSKYPPGSLSAAWAAIVLSRIKAPPADADAGPLFAGERPTYI